MLYKYANWNNYIKDNIKNNILWFNTPEQFNDPFDIFANFQMDEQDRLYAENLFDKQGCNIQIVKEISTQDILALQTIGDRSNLHNSKYGITCFSKNNDNILMWAHYADKHQGICLGFDIDEKDIHLEKFMDEKNKELDESLSYKLLQIGYGYNRPEFKFSGNNTEELLRTKSNQWQYENEIRIMARSNKYMAFSKGLYYKPSCLKKIILGANMPLIDFLDLYEFKIKNKLNLDLYIAELDKSEYRLNITPGNSKEQEILYRNISYLKNSLHTVVIGNEFWKGYKRNEIELYWRKSIDKISLYNIKTYMPCFLQMDMAPEFQKDKISINEISIKAIIFLDMIQKQMEYEKFLSDKIAKQQ